MARVSVRSLDTAKPLDGSALEYFGQNCPIQLRLQRLAAGAGLAIEPATHDTLVYVWNGEVEAAGHRLAQGSALIAERGAALALAGRAEASNLLVFSGAPAHPREGGHVHLLPRERVPVIAQMSASGVRGALFADARCPSCEVWLHENRFPKPSGEPIDARAGIHSHEEDEVIFVTEGQMRLGQKLVGPGTAIAIAAGTLYGFTPGPEGLTFVNFRAGRPREIHFADGRTADEVAIWSRADRPLEYIPLG